MQPTTTHREYCCETGPFAALCQRARLSPIEANALQLTAGGASFRAVAVALNLRYPIARRIVLRAAERVRDSHADLIALQLRLAREILSCVRNIHPRRHREMPRIYAPIPGGYDDRPVSFRSIPFGMVAEDLVSDQPLAFVRSLPYLLARREQERSVSA